MYVSLVGRANVGKSSLFNSILAHAGRQGGVLRSIVSELPGTTRDSKHGHFYLRGRRVTLVDTGGLEPAQARNAPAAAPLEREARRAVSSSDLVLFVLDGSQGVTPLDLQLATRVRSWAAETAPRPEVRLVINKLDDEGSERHFEDLANCLADCHEFELGDPLVVSAHHRRGIEHITQIIQSKLPPGDVSRLEEASIMSNRPREARGTDPDRETEDLSDPVDPDLHRHCEIEKTLRVCSSVRGAYRPSDRWMRLLNSVCGIPFARHEDDRFVVPSLSPAERLANLYLSDPPKADHSGDTLDYLNEEFTADEALEDAHFEPEDLSTDSQICAEAELEEALKGASSSSSNRRLENLYNQFNESSSAPGFSATDHSDLSPENSEQDAKTAEKPGREIHSTKTKVQDRPVNPITVLLLGTVDSDRDRVLSLLCDQYTRGEFSDSSPNWHSFYTQWHFGATPKTRLKGQETAEAVPSTGTGAAGSEEDATTVQPVEIVVASPLNLGGSLGKMAVLQTLALLRKCDAVIFCVNNTDDAPRTREGIKNLNLSKREISWLSRALRFQKPVAIAALLPAQAKGCKIALNREYPFSFELKNVPIVPLFVSMSEARLPREERAMAEPGIPRVESAGQPTRSKARNKLKTMITSLLEAGRRMVDTSTLNAWLREFVAKWPPPWKDGSKLNIKFAAQVRTGPPTFVLWSNVYATFPPHYLRQLKLALSEEFGFLGVPLKFVLKTTFKATPPKGRLGLKLRRRLFT